VRTGSVEGELGADFTFLELPRVGKSAPEFGSSTSTQDSPASRNRLLPEFNRDP
jgi:hypothetical protein